MNESHETRVRFGVKQGSKGRVQMDVTAEAPGVAEAGMLLDKAIKELKTRLASNGLKTVDQE